MPSFYPPSTGSHTSRVDQQALRAVRLLGPGTVTTAVLLVAGPLHPSWPRAGAGLGHGSVRVFRYEGVYCVISCLVACRVVT